MKKYWTISYIFMLVFFICFIVFNLFLNYIDISLYIWILGLAFYGYIWVNTKNIIEDLRKILYLKYFIIIQIIIVILLLLTINQEILLETNIIYFLFFTIIVSPMFFIKYKQVLLYNKAYKNYKKNNFIKALKNLKKLEEFFNDDFYYNLIIGESYIKLEKYIIGINHIKRAKSLIKNKNMEDNVWNMYFLRVLYNIGLGYQKINNEGKAEKYYIDALKYIDSSKKDTLDISFSIYKNLGLLYYNLNEYNKSLSYYNKALKINENSRLKFFLANTHYKLKNYIEAEEIFLSLLNNFPEDILIVYYKLIKIYTNMGNDKKAYEYLVEATNKNIEFYRTYTMFDKKDLISDNVKERFLKYLVNDITDEQRELEYIGVIVYTLFRLDKDNKVKDYLDTLISKYPKHEETYYWNIIFLLRQSKYNEAKRVYYESLENNIDIIHNYNWNEVNLEIKQIKEILS